jgi:hypothetical protein
VSGGLAPEIGALFHYRGNHYRVSAWLKTMPPPAEPAWHDRNVMRDLLDDLLYTTQQEVGPDRCRVVFCPREEAVYVSGVGVAGCIARMADIEVTGMVDWSPQQLAEARASAERLAGTPVS